MKKKPIYTSPYELDGRIPLRQAIPLGLQHVLAMFVGNLSPLLIILGTCGLTVDAGFSALRVTLLQNAMVIAGLCAKGTTEVEDVRHIERGYETPVEKLRGLGADIREIEVPDQTL